MGLRALACALLLSALAAGGARADAVPHPTFPAGTNVEVEYHGTWYRGYVLERLHDGAHWRISYDGYGPEWFEVIDAARIRPRSPPPPPQPPAPPPGRALTHVGRVGPGTNVLVEWHGTWYRARMVRALDATHARIHYVGYDASSDEDVPADRVRMPAKSTRRT